MSKAVRPYAVAFAAAFASLAVYLPALRNGFVNWDDYTYVLENVHIRHLNGTFFTWALTDMSTDYWLPLGWISHAVDYALWGLNPAGHHLTSVLFHAANTFLVAVLLVRLLRLANDRSAAGRGDGASDTGSREDRAILTAGGAAALLFGLHPLHVESVAWVSERKDLLCAFFYLLSVTAYTWYASPAERDGLFRRGPHAVRGGGWYLLSLLFFLLALSSKPMAVTLPAVLLLLDWYPLGRIASWKDFAAKIPEKIPFAVLSLAVSITAIAAQTANRAVLSLDRVPAAERILTAFQSIAGYLGKLIAPVRLLPVYGHPGTVSLLSARSVLSAAAVFGITAACFFLAKRQKVFITAWAYYLITLLPILGIVRVGSVSSADRFTYLPAIGLFLLAGAGFARLWTAADVREPWHAKKVRRSVAVASAAVLILLSFLTIRQISLWNDSVRLWSATIDSDPDHAQLAYNLRGLAFKERGQIERAIRDYDSAIALSPDYGYSYLNRGIAYQAAGQYEGAVRDLTAALALEPTNSDAYRWRGLTLAKQGKRRLAAEDFSRAIALRPSDAVLYIDRGRTLKDMGDVRSALDDFTSAIEHDPMLTDAFIHRGIVFKELGQFDLALADYSRAIALDPSSAAAYNNRGVVYKYLGRPEEALSDYDRAIAADASFSQAHINRGVVLEMTGRMREALESYSAAVASGPELDAAYFLRGNLYLKTGDAGRAADDFRKACDLGNDRGCEAMHAAGPAAAGRPAGNRASTP